MHFTYFVILNASLFAKVELPKIATDYARTQKPKEF